MAGDRVREGSNVADPSSDSSLLRILHVVVQAGPTNSQWNEHCLPVADERQLTVCSLFPATVAGDPRITRLEGDGSLRGALAVLRRALREGDYDVVHVHAPASAALLVAACALERRGRCDVVFTLHNSWPNLRPRNRWLAALAFAAFPVIVACSRSAAESVPAPVRRLARHGIDVVPNGVDVDRIDRLPAGHAVDGAAPDRPRDGVTVATVGRLIPIKDQATLLAAFARAAGSGDLLVVVGEGPLRPDLEHQARRLGIAGQLRLPGLLPRDEVYRVLGEADLFVSPSLGEGLPLSVLEAGASGLPVVLSDIPPHREIVAAMDGTEPVDLVQVGDVAGLAAAIAHLRDMDRDERAALGERNRRMVVDRFSLPSMAGGYHRIYSRMSGRTPSRAQEVA
ncbi:MAG TPA: glycosyltransferase family 4 protein [Nocardioidaceae bacterium]|nr:glycosyltransferase family 4 protein [Nocardioidaceae bacterium]